MRHALNIEMWRTVGAINSSQEQKSGPIVEIRGASVHFPAR